MDAASEGSTPLPPPPPSGLVSGDYAIKPLGGLVTAIGVLVPITAGLGLLFALLNELSLNDARLFLGVDFRNRIRELLRARAHPATRPNPHTTRCRHQRHRLDETPRITSRADWKDVNLETGVGGRRLVRSTAHLLCDSVSHVSGTMEGHRSTH